MWNQFGVRSCMHLWLIDWGSICLLYICALSYVWNLCGVMILHAAMVNCLEVHLPVVYMCILLYVKLMRYNGVAQIYGWLEEGWGQSAIGICALCYIWNLFSAMVFQGSMLAWRGVGSICHGYMCILLYMKLFGVMVFHGSMVDWRRGWGQLTTDPCNTNTPHQSAQGICTWCYVWNWCGVVVFHGSMVNWRRGWGQSVMKLMQCSGLPWIYGQLEEEAGFSLLWKLFGIMVFQRSMLDWLGVHWPK